MQIENDFELNFRQCLDPKVLVYFRNAMFTRDEVESTFQQNLQQYVDDISTAVRMSNLVTEAHKGDIISLVEFLMAYQHSDENSTPRWVYSSSQ